VRSSTFENALKCSKGLFLLIGAQADYKKADELKAAVAAAIAGFSQQTAAKDDSEKNNTSNSGATIKKIQASENPDNSLAIRTDFSDESAWKSICDAINHPDNEFEACLDFINDRAYDGLKIEQLSSILSHRFFSHASILNHKVTI
jgi:hypothetical protein